MRYFSLNIAILRIYFQAKPYRLEKLIKKTTHLNSFLKWMHYTAVTSLVMNQHNTEGNRQFGQGGEY